MSFFKKFESSLSGFKIFCDKTKFNTLKFDWVSDPANPAQQRQKEYTKTYKNPKEGFISTGNIQKKIKRVSMKLLKSHVTDVNYKICAIMFKLTIKRVLRFSGDQILKNDLWRRLINEMSFLAVLE